MKQRGNTSSGQYAIEGLENRVFLSASLVRGVITITPPNDHAPQHTVDVSLPADHGLAAGAGNSDVVTWTPTGEPG